MLRKRAMFFNHISTSLLKSLALHFLVLALIIFGLENVQHKATQPNAPLSFTLTDKAFILHTQTTPQRVIPSAALPSTTGKSPAITESTSMGSATAHFARASTIREQYLAELRALIESRKQYPHGARALKQTGTVEIEFTVLKDGKITQINLTKGTAFTRINEAARSLIQSIHDVKPIPSELNVDSLKVTLPVSYQLHSAN